MSVRRASGVASEAPPQGGARCIPLLQQLSRSVLRARWLRPVHGAAQALLGVSQEPGVLSGTTRRQERRGPCGDAGDLVVLSANLEHDWPRHRRMEERLETVARMVEAEGANVVLLQEVSRTQHLWADHFLAERLGMDYVYTRVNGDRPSIGFEEGLAVFSCLPLRRYQTRRLTRPGAVAHRLALGAQVESRAGPVWMFSVHLSMRSRRNARQVSDLEGFVRSVAGTSSAVVGGDFNADEKTPQMIRVRQTWMDIFRLMNPKADGATHALRGPWGQTLRRRRLDYLFLHHGMPGWQVIESRIVGGPQSHSDHRAVVARLRPAADHRPQTSSRPAR